MLTKWLKYLVNTYLFVQFVSSGYAQNNAVTLQNILKWSESNYPVFKKVPLIKNAEEKSISNLNSGFLPQVNFNAQASYQSDVTQLNIPISGVKVEPLNKDQYRLTADITQLIYDGGMLREQKALQHLTAQVDQAKIHVESYQLKSRVAQLYLLVLYQNALLKQADLYQKDIELAISKVKPQVEYQVILKSNLYVLDAQLLQTKQKSIEIRNTRNSYLKMLSVYTGKPVDELVPERFVSPMIDTAIQIVRPEIDLFEKQKDLLESQKNIIDRKLYPKASLFLQGGFGRPGLNMLLNNFDAFYIAGVRLNWSLGNLYNTKRDKQLVDISKSMVDADKESFLLKTKEQLEQQHGEIEKYDELVKTDRDIIEIRKKISASSRAQLENNVITVNDYLREINAEDQANQALIVHQMQLLQARINYQIILGDIK